MRVKTSHARDIRPRSGQRLGRSDAQPIGDPFMQGQAPTVFPRQVRNECDMDAETGGRGQALQRAQARTLGSSLIRSYRWLRGAGRRRQRGLGQTGDSPQASNRIHAP